MAVDEVELDTGAGRARALAERLPRPLRFIVVGASGSSTDLCVFTVIAGFGHHPLAVAAGLARGRDAGHLAAQPRAHLRRAAAGAQPDEAMRYAAVTAVAQGTSYAVFAALVLTVLAPRCRRPR